MSVDYSQDELRDLLGAVGESVKIHRSVLFFSPDKIRIASNVRIDCHCVLSAGPQGIVIGNFVHVGAATHFFGSGGPIVLEDYCGISSRVSFFTVTEDYTGGNLSNPTIPMEYKNLQQGPIVLRKHVVVGCGSVLMPNVEIGLAGSVGALSFVHKSIPEFTVVMGVPARKIAERNRQILEIEKKFLEDRI